MDSRTKNVLIVMMTLALLGQSLIIANATAKLGAMRMILTNEIHDNVALGQQLFQCQASQGLEK